MFWDHHSDVSAPSLHSLLSVSGVKMSPAEIRGEERKPKISGPIFYRGIKVKGNPQISEPLFCLHAICSH